MTRAFAILLLLASALPAAAQTAPTREEIAVYAGLHEAAAKGNVAAIEQFVKDGEKLNIQDAKSRTPLHVAVYMKQHAAARALLAPTRTRSKSTATTSSPSPRWQTTWRC